MSSARIQREKRTIEAMIAMRCHVAHGAGHWAWPAGHWAWPARICDDCGRLLSYAVDRIDRCAFGSPKPVCNRCPVHCYSRSMREEVRAVMRFSGPRMMLGHPLLATLHILDGLRFRPRAAVDGRQKP